MTDFIGDNSLVDVWRNQNAGKKQYSWYKPNGAWNNSGIDYWLSVDVLEDLISQRFVTRAPLTDNCLTGITLNASYTRKKNKAYWKFNTHVLQNEKYYSEIR